MYRVLFLLVLLSAALCLPAVASAQPVEFPAYVDSLEWMVADSQVIVRAIVADIRPIKSRNATGRCEVKLSVSQTLKGKHETSRTIAVNSYTADVNGWKEDMRPLLVFLADSERFLGSYPILGRHPLSLRDIRGAKSVMPLDSRKDIQFLATDLRVHRERDDLMTLVQRAIDDQKGSEPPKSHVLMLPRVAPEGVSAPWLKYRHNMQLGVFLTVPATEQLERYSQRWIESPAWELRREGARALRHFKSDDNIARLKPLLDDPAWSKVFRGGDQGTFRYYWVRRDAYTTLKSWDDQIQEPVWSVPWQESDGEGD